MDVRLTLNGRAVTVDVEPHELLLDVLRDRLGVLSAKPSCGVQVCGACSVLVDDVPVSSCCYLACETDGRQVLTVEGLRDDPITEALAAAFVRNAAVQCGFCTPGMIVTLRALLAQGQARDRAQVQSALRGNLCRCTGYRSILDSACEVAGMPRP